MSNYSIERIRNFASEMAVDGEPSSADRVQQGYLFIVSGTPALTMLEENAQQHCTLGADVRGLVRADLRALLPSLHVGVLDGAEAA
jgi:hypothetical protein